MSLDELLSAQSGVLKFSSPPDRVKNALAGWLDKAQCLVGLGEQAYVEDHKDLVALRPAKGEDRLSQFLRDHCSHWMKVQYYTLQPQFRCLPICTEAARTASTIVEQIILPSRDTNFQCRGSVQYSDGGCSPRWGNSISVLRNWTSSPIGFADNVDRPFCFLCPRLVDGGAFGAFCSHCSVWQSTFFV